MSKIAFLHVGLHKTASTSFQLACAEQKDLLNQAGIAYPVFTCEEANQSYIVNHSIPLYSLFSSSPESYHINIRWGIRDIEGCKASYSRQLSKALDESESIILSGEDVSLLSAREL